jgi:hypothetical protein
MDFISLHDLMDELASKITPQRSNSEEARYSEAARDLHQRLMISAGRPQWFKINKNTSRPIPDNSASDKGIAMLEHMAGWEKRTKAAHCRYIGELKSAKAQGVDESLILPEINQADLMYKGADMLMAMEIGFDRQEIAVFLGRAYTQTNIGTANEPVDVKRVGKRLSKHLSHLEIVSLWIDTKEHRNVMNHYRETIHQAFWDGDAQYDEKLTKAIHDNHELKDRYFKAINQAVADGDLKAETSVSDSGVRNWKTILYSPIMLRTVQGDTGIYEGREVYVHHMINRDDFRAWLEKTHQWPVSDDCLLAQWFETEQTEEKGTYQEWHNQRLDDYLLRMSKIKTNDVAYMYGVTDTVIRRAEADGVFIVNWDYWLALKKWTPKQAVCLFFGINPNEFKSSQYPRFMREQTQYAELKGNMTPYQWKQFGLEQGIPLTQQILDIQEPADQQPEPKGVNGGVKISINDIGHSNLLNIPAKIDGWFEAIDDMTRAFYNQYKKMPNVTQAWAQLSGTPPDGYNITTGEDKGEDCLNMPGSKPLSISGFKKRWGSYTTNKPK